MRKDVKLGENDGPVTLGMARGLKISIRSQHRFSGSEEVEHPLVEQP